MWAVRLMLFLGVLAAALEVPAAQAGPPASLRRFALIASSNEGGTDRIPLRFADSDARAMADVLRHLGGVRDQDLVLLTGASRASFLASFARLRSTIRQATAGGGRRELFIYYSGHSDEEGLLLAGQRLTYGELRRLIDETDAEVRIAVLDSCASGALIRLRGGTRRPPFLGDISADARGHAFLTASSANEAAQESDRIGAAFFTHSLVSGLRGAADITRDGVVTLAEAYQFAYHETLQRTAKTSAGAQHPAYDMQLAGIGDLVLTDLRSSSGTLLVDEDVAGRLFVRDRSGRLMVELRKEPVTVRLGLAPGLYRVVLERDGRSYQASARLGDRGAPTRLASRHFAAAPVHVATARGGAPEPTLLGQARRPGPRRRFGGYAGVGFGETHVGHEAGFLVSNLELALLLHQRLALGMIVGGGESGALVDGDTIVTLGHGGFLARVQFLCDSRVLCYSVGASVGALAFSRETDIAEEAVKEDILFLFEPRVAGYVNVARHFRIALEIGYRVVSGADAISERDVRGFTWGFSTQFGWF